MLTEATVRTQAAREFACSGAEPTLTVFEFWLPLANARADLALVGSELSGFEIKTERDTLQRLSRQVPAYGGVFDTCTALFAERHLEQALELLPSWWGVSLIRASGRGVVFATVRAARPNGGVDPEMLVRLLWKEEVREALRRHGVSVQPRASRGAMWRELLQVVDLDGLRRAVREALLARYGAAGVSQPRPLLAG